MQNQDTSLRQDAKVIGLVGLAHSISHFSHLILAPLFPWIKQAFQLSYAELGWLMSVFFIVSGIGQALAGFVVDKIGALKVLCFGLLCLGCSALVLGYASSYPILLLGAMLAGLGNSVFHPADYAILNQRISPKRLAYAFSVHGITGNLGWVCAPLFLVGIASTTNWHSALLAAAILPFSILALLLFNRHFLETKIAKKTAHQVQNQEHVLNFLRLPAVWQCFAFFLIIALALGGIQSFAVASLQSMYAMSLVLATSAYTSYMIASALGMVIGGFLASKTSRHDYIIAWAFLISGSVMWLIATGWLPSWFIVGLMGLVGFGAGIAGPSRDLMIRAAAPKNATGRVYGVVYSGLDSGLALAPLLFGVILDANQPKWVFICIGIFQILALLTAVNVGKRTAHGAGALQAN
ncbi:MFS transporter [Solimicrobium silvestre]|uniref:Major Facilitator Superfamily n=1 Tax=Solimicrobium silvestre TaxID=2099400 RepID=A0A2S9GUY9_9BURK|nr:MFS transporter [Solimicrobium silvestre]PRC91518.1 Major Facilitator Superfamily [Solimicrobium silvestre]